MSVQVMTQLCSLWQTAHCSHMAPKGHQVAASAGHRAANMGCQTLQCRPRGRNFHSPPRHIVVLPEHLRLPLLLPWTGQGC